MNIHHELVFHWFQCRGLGDCDSQDVGRLVQQIGTEHLYVLYSEVKRHTVIGFYEHLSSEQCDETKKNKKATIDG